MGEGKINGREGEGERERGRSVVMLMGVGSEGKKLTGEKKMKEDEERIIVSG